MLNCSSVFLDKTLSRAQLFKTNDVASYGTVTRPLTVAADAYG